MTSMLPFHGNRYLSKTDTYNLKERLRERSGYNAGRTAGAIAVACGLTEVAVRLGLSKDATGSGYAIRLAQALGVPIEEEPDAGS